VLIIVSREHEEFYQGVKARQESNGRDRVILDRRNGERRRAGVVPRHGERRNGSRRLPLSDAERALMNVLGFTVLHRELQVLSGGRSPGGSAPAPQAPKQGAARPAKSPRRRAAG
jgi:hypothetical protein